LRFAQPRAIGLKVSDEFTVPLCRGHHRQLHQAGNEVTWWDNLRIKPLEVAKALWEETHPKAGSEPGGKGCAPDSEATTSIDTSSQKKPVLPA
jgi:hypothetical protein